MSRNLSHFFQVYWFVCIELFVVISDGSLYFCGIGGNISVIIFYCIYLIFFLFFFINLPSGQFVDLFKKPAPGFIDFSKGILCLFLLQFSSDLSYFLSSAGF